MSEHDTLIRQIALAARRRRLHRPAALLLETLRPLAFVGGQLLWVSQPALSLFWQKEQVGRLAQLFESPENVDRLIATLGDLPDG